LDRLLRALIVLLSLLQYGINRDIPEDDPSTGKEQGAAKNIDHTGNIARAIGTYSRTRQTHEDKRTRREWITAAFALVAAFAAIASALIFYCQLNIFNNQLIEMQRAGVDTGKLAEASQKTLVMSQRPWLYINGNIEFGNFDPYAKTMTAFAASALVQNEGHSIATDIEVNGRIVSRWNIPGSTIPMANFPIVTKAIPCSHGSFLGHSLVEQDAIPAQRMQNISFTGEIAPDSLMITNRVRPYLLGCIQYKWPVTDHTFHTWFWVAIGVVDGKTGEVWNSPGIPEKVRTVRGIGEISYIDAD
jgi:hypothetical protein